MQFVFGFFAALVLFLFWCFAPACPTCGGRAGVHNTPAHDYHPPPLSEEKVARIKRLLEEECQEDQ